MRSARYASLAVALLCAPIAVHAGATVVLDVATLNELLPALTVDELEVPLGAGTSMRVRLESLEVTAFQPAAAGAAADRILGAARVRVPQLGLTVPLRPALSLRVVAEEGRSLLELRFESAELSLPLTGAIDVAPLLPPLRFPADNLWTLDGAAGEIEVETRLTAVRMSASDLRFDFAVDVPETGSPR
jgi:hypothetical protein